MDATNKPTREALIQEIQEYLTSSFRGRSPQKDKQTAALAEYMKLTPWACGNNPNNFDTALFEALVEKAEEQKAYWDALKQLSIHWQQQKDR